MGWRGGGGWDGCGGDVGGLELNILGKCGW